MRLHDLLAKAFPGTRTHQSVAALKAHVVLSVTGRGPRTIKVTSERVHDGGIVGGVLASGQGFSVTALMGTLMVIGIAVSNGVLLVDDANQRFISGANQFDAALRAARSRFVPIAMTSAATITGLLPTALGLDIASAANRPLPLAVVGGLLSSTVLSLFLVPVMFTLLARRPVRSVVIVEAPAIA